jgi:alkylhydroperoxidase family enzyme
MRYEGFRKRLVDAVLNAPGETPEALRRAVLEQRSIPPALAGYVDTVKRHAYKVTDADVAALQRSGQSDDTLFEITVAAAVGAALHRLDRGMAALRGEEPD